MIEIRKPILVEKAVELVINHTFTGQSEIISIEACDGRRLAEPLIARNDVPSFNKSPYDGFALRSVDTLDASLDHPVQFEVIEHIGAGQVPKKKLEAGQATRIMTGAQIPDGADCVAMFEVCQSVETEEKSIIRLKRKMEKGQNIIELGSEVKEGEVLVEAGEKINPGVKALLATFGYDKVAVAKRPRVGIIATGTELLNVDEPLEPGKIRNSNAHMIASQVTRAGADYIYFGKLKDELETSYQTISEALKQVDVLITTGGVSVGDWDLLPDIYEKLGAEVLFNKLAMRPGSVTTVAVKENKLLFGLSGNPSACYVGFELFVHPIIQAALFNKRPFHKRVKAMMMDNFPKPNPFSRFVRSYISYEEDRLKVHLAGVDKSNVVTSLSSANALMILPGGTRGYKAGDMVNVLLLENDEGQAAFLPIVKE
ncbi:gephyrin-like molybdotransferase Glp [Virgibacillus sp. LDC-1]|uniref:molybdopterin molybdotransferase MoeA n=1 Tax=Virgibacillus sp. LDC-1 TaxID=3039856 RepID=UPI0024DEF003|nr:gephyrin-like molybdotransferase Glp [Virgibacillus sp. LDC-1]